MHQEHSIPWNQLASNFKFVRDCPHYTPRATGIFPRHLPNQTKDLKYFASVLAKTIRTFADTERQKYDDAQLVVARNGRLISEDLVGRYPNWYDGLGDGKQWVQNWERNSVLNQYAKPPRQSYLDPHASDLSSAVEILLLENQLQPLLVLAHNPKTPIGTLDVMGQSCNLGFSRVMYATLHAYILFNLSAALGILEDGRYVETYGNKVLLSELGMWDTRTRLKISSSLRYASGKEPHWDGPMGHDDFTLLREYMKACFAVLYRYDIVLRECGKEPEWEAYIAHTLGQVTYPSSLRARW